MTNKTQRIKPWQLPPQRTYIFRNANIVDSEKGTIRRGCDVQVSDGLIDKIEEGQIPDTDGVIVVDLAGRFLCPGLIDAHVHLMAVPGFEDLSKAFGNPFAVSAFRQPYVCQQMLSRGFTSVRDCGGASYALKEAIEDGVFPGPRLFLSVHALSQTGGHADIRMSPWKSDDDKKHADKTRDPTIMNNAVVVRTETLDESAMGSKIVSKLRESRSELVQTSSKSWLVEVSQRPLTSWSGSNSQPRKSKQSSQWQEMLK